MWEDLDPDSLIIWIMVVCSVPLYVQSLVYRYEMRKMRNTE